MQQQLNDAKSQGRRSGSANGPLGDDEYEDAQSKWMSFRIKQKVCFPEK